MLLKRCTQLLLSTHTQNYCYQSAHKTIAIKVPHKTIAIKAYTKLLLSKHTQTYLRKYHNIIARSNTYNCAKQYALSDLYHYRREILINPASITYAQYLVVDKWITEMFLFQTILEVYIGQRAW